MSIIHKSKSPLKIAKSLKDYWSPVIISEVNNFYVKVAKLKGTFVWHKHDEEDEMFMVLKGKLVIKFKKYKVKLKKGDTYVIPKGLWHNPVAKNECLVMLFEDKNTAHTGDTEHENSKSIEDQLSSYQS